MRIITRILEEGKWRTRSGLPPLTCPECGEDGRHWVPDSLKGPGYFTCATRDVGADDGFALFNLTDIQ